MTVVVGNWYHKYCAARWWPGAGIHAVIITLLHEIEYFSKV